MRFLSVAMAAFLLSVVLAQGPGAPKPPAATTTSVTAKSISSSTAISKTSSSSTSISSTATSAPPSSQSTATTTTSLSPTATDADVYLSVPTLSVGKIELNVENLSADLNLNAAIAQLVTINAGVKVSVQKVNLTISDVDASVELIVRLGNLVQIVQRVFSSLDLNPLLIQAISTVGDVVGDVVGAVDGLLGSITQGGTTLNFLVDNLGNIVQSVTGAAGQVTNTIVGDYLTNMTATGDVTTLANGLVQKTYLYKELNSLVDIVFNAQGQIVQATVQGKGGSSGSTSSAAVTATATSSVVGSSSATATMAT